MIAVGRKVHPAASTTTRRLLEAEYMVFLVAIDTEAVAHGDGGGFSK